MALALTSAPPKKSYWSVSLTKSERKWKYVRLSDFQYLSYSRQLTINFASDLDAIFYQLKVPLFPLVVAIKTCTMCTPIDAKTWKRKDLIGRSSNSDYQEIYLIQTILVSVSSQRLKLLRQLIDRKMEWAKLSDVKFKTRLTEDGRWLSAFLASSNKEAAKRSRTNNNPMSTRGRRQNVHLWPATK